ncbi:DUF1064 domain-containing protein [Bacillus wiedmannii]|uniref:DUF1064 domain-containing protein n=1 Tax=Bacillus wiedmannii TaxID=1890302 RepID=UPI002E1C1EDB|nr:DUF1064 domain-containing protein [Bacillus wiedmannii]
MSKYNNKKVRLDGHILDSKAEADYYFDLKIRKTAGEHMEKVEKLDDFWKERLNGILDEKDALRKMHINVRATEETAAKEREHRLELQGRSQVLGMALKAVL